MGAISPKLVKELREMTGAGLKDCKAALEEGEGNIDKAIEVIRKKGLAKAAKKAGRATKEGEIRCVTTDKATIFAEIVCETDFAAKNQKFIDFVDGVLERIAAGDYAEGDITEAVQDAEKDNVGAIVGTIGENIQITRVVRWETAGNVYNYIHDGGGVKIAALVDVEGVDDAEFGKLLAMHITASAPQYISPEDVPAELVEKERDIAASTPDMANKPENIIGKIVDGRINKWYTEICLLKQNWIHDDKISVEKAKPGIKINRFVRWQVGEISPEPTEED